MRDLPAGVRALIGGKNISLSSASGYLQARLFSTTLAILLVVYAMTLGARAIGAAEEDGTLHLVRDEPRDVRPAQSARSGRRVIALPLFLLAAVVCIATIALGAPVDVLDDVSAGRLALAQRRA